MAYYENCLLGSLNLPKYISNKYESEAKFNYNLFEKDVYLAVNILNKCSDLNSHPLEEQNEMDDFSKRIGLGFTGLADAIAMMGYKYGSQESIDFIEKFMKIKSKNEVIASMNLAIENGCCKAMETTEAKHGFINNKFFNTIFHESDETTKTIKKNILVYGTRNTAFATVPPAGTLSILANNCTSGIEPIFSFSYKRKNRIDSKEYSFIHKYACDWALENNFNGTIEELQSKLNYNYDSNNISWQDRINVQAITQKYCDSSISSCLTSDTIISTNSGLCSLNEIVNLSSKNNGFNNIEEQNIIVRNVNNQDVSVKEVFINGKHECIKIKTELGKEITGTLNHKLVVLSNNGDFTWKQINDLTVDDYIVCRKGLNKFGDSQKSIQSLLGGFNQEMLTNSKPFIIPRRMTKDLARFIGYITSDGGLTKNGFFLSQQNNNVVCDFQYLTKKIFDLDVSIVEDKRAENLVSVVCNSRNVMRYLKYIGINKGAGNKVVPNIILKCAGREQTKEFIKGLTLDGYVREDKICVMTSISHDLLRYTQELLTQFGIRSGIYESSKESSRKFPNSDKIYNTKKSWSLICCGEEARKFVNYIGFAEQRKIDLCKKYFNSCGKYRNNVFIPGEFFKSQFRKNILPKIKSKTLYDLFHSKTENIANRKLIRIESLKMFKDMGMIFDTRFIDDTYDFVKIKSIENIGEKHTYDLSVPNGHSYIANGFVSHNTINLPNSVTPEDIYGIYIEAWKAGLKGITVFRDGCKDGVLSSNNKKEGNQQEQQECFVPEIYKKELLDLERSRRHRASWKGSKLYINVSIDSDDMPIEIFAKLPKEAGMDSNKNYNPMLWMERNSNWALSSRLISMALRYGISLEEIIKQCDKSSSSMVDAAGVISRILKKYIKMGIDEETDQPLGIECPECNQMTYIFEGGCKKCLNCGYSACG